MSDLAGAAKLVEMGVAGDEQRLAQVGVEQYTAEAVPHYVGWIRQDVVGLFFFAERTANYARAIAVLLVLIAIPLWGIAWKLWS